MQPITLTVSDLIIGLFLALAFILMIIYVFVAKKSFLRIAVASLIVSFTLMLNNVWPTIVSTITLLLIVVNDDSSEETREGSKNKETNENK